MDAYELLWQHTVFPYVTAFMSEAETNRLTWQLLGGRAQSNAVLAQAATLGTLGQRYCVQCLKEDQDQFGEVYWHREHNLPVVLVCPKHNIALRVTEDLQPRRRYFARRLPENSLGKAPKILLPDDWAEAINDLSQDLLNRRGRRTPAAWARHYRYLAENKGLAVRGAGLASRAFANAFRDTFGLAFLKSTGLAFPPNSEGWPALMLRENQRTPFTASKHVLLQVFLHSAVSLNAAVEYRPPGPAPRDYAAFDAQCLQKLRKVIGDVRRNDRVGVTELLTDLDVWHVYRHNRDRLPKTKALLAEFRKTDCSARQIGRRPRIYK